MTKRLLLALLSVAAVSCGGSSESTTSILSGTQSGAFVGAYSLSPNATQFVVYQQPNYKFEMTGGTFNVGADFTWSFQINFKLTNGSQVTNPIWTDRGTYVISSGTPSFLDSFGKPTSNVSLVPTNNQAIVVQELPTSVAVPPTGGRYQIVAIFAK